VVITGLGCISPSGDATLSDPGALSHFFTAGSMQNSAVLSIENFQLGNYLSSQKTYLDRCSALALAGCALALRDAGIETPLPEEAGPRFGITLGTHLGCLATMKGFWDKATERGVRLANPLLFSHSYFNSPISLCAIEFGLKGYHTTLCAGKNSGIEAIRAAFDVIRLGHAEAMLCGGVEALTPERTLLDPQESAGEASVFFVLENEELAVARIAKNARTLSESQFSASPSLTGANDSVFGGATSALAFAASCCI
ncbi:MAG TPA: beta-ketoacyl synthase N-terminal-like domain-containing protein, partial [Abditibacteriaceae bacterium]